MLDIDISISHFQARKLSLAICSSKLHIIMSISMNSDNSFKKHNWANMSPEWKSQDLTLFVPPSPQSTLLPYLLFLVVSPLIPIMVKGMGLALWLLGSSENSRTLGHLPCHAVMRHLNPNTWNGVWEATQAAGISFVPCAKEDHIHSPLEYVRGSTVVSGYGLPYNQVEIKFSTAYVVFPIPFWH